MSAPGELQGRIGARIRREGPITFADYMERALYDEVDGFFARGEGAGTAGRDFVTSPEVGTLYGALMANAIDLVWREQGEPDPFVVVEAGAGRGRLASDVLRAAPDCALALRYVLVERSETLRARQHELLTIEPTDAALGPFVRAADEEEPDEPMGGVGPIVASLDELPALSMDRGLVIANELLDNLPVRVVERSTSGWNEVRVGLDDAERLGEVIVEAAPDLATEADAVAAGREVSVGARLPVPTAVLDWLARCASLLHRGDVVLVDYAADARQLVERGIDGWMRTYRAQGRGTAPLDDPGTQDITCDVPVEYLRTVASRAGFDVVLETTQAVWLEALGLDVLVAAGEATWQERAHLGDLVAIAGRSRTVEARALTDPTGLGAHRVTILRRRIV
jgi:SAM-dependent MidA family methyltransferase